VSDRLSVSLVATVLNEYDSLPGWLAGLSAQTVFPDECVIVDGGSSDGTYEYLRAARPPFPMRVIRRPGCTISQGRNAAIDEAFGDVIATTDAGTRAKPDWLERLVEPFHHSEEVDVVAGFFEPVERGIWSSTLGAATLPDAAEIEPAAFLASSRSLAVRRAWFEGGFRYPQWLDFCEDVVLDFQLRRAGARQVFEPNAVVEFEVRPSPLAFARQYFRYARGDGKAGLFAKRHMARYTSYGLATAVLARRRRTELAAAAALGLLYLRAPIVRYLRRRSGTRLGPLELAQALGLIAFQKVLGDNAKMAGYPAGIVWRITRDRSPKLWKTGWASRARDGSVRRR
jgi:cellulose synthase/poly-beta-1,6-N-acetylglucosamine synthase-like glycosyltransferase